MGDAMELSCVEEGISSGTSSFCAFFGRPRAFFADAGVALFVALGVGEPWRAFLLVNGVTKAASEEAGSGVWKAFSSAGASSLAGEDGSTTTLGLDRRRIASGLAFSGFGVASIVSEAGSSIDSCVDSALGVPPPFFGVDLRFLFSSTVVFLCLFACVGVSRASNSLFPTVFFAELAGVAAMPGVSVPRRVVTIVMEAAGAGSLVGASSTAWLEVPWYEGVRLMALLAAPKSCANMIFERADPEKVQVARLQESGPLGGAKTRPSALHKHLSFIMVIPS